MGEVNLLQMFGVAPCENFPKRPAQPWHTGPWRRAMPRALKWRPCVSPRVIVDVPLVSLPFFFFQPISWALAGTRGRPRRARAPLCSDERAAAATRATMQQQVTTHAHAMVGALRQRGSEQRGARRSRSKACSTLANRLD